MILEAREKNGRVRSLAENVAKEIKLNETI